MCKFSCIPLFTPHSVYTQSSVSFFISESYFHPQMLSAAWPLYLVLSQFKAHAGVSSHSFRKYTYLFVSSHLNLSHNLSANNKVSSRWRNIGNWPVLTCLEKQSRNSCWKMYTTVDVLFSTYCMLWVKQKMAQVKHLFMTIWHLRSFNVE